MLKKYRNKRFIFIRNILVFIVLLWSLFPFIWMFVTSIKSNAELYNIESNPFIVKDPTFEHIKYLFTDTSFLIWFRNSIIVSIIVTLLTLIISFLAGYSLSRLRFRGSTFWGLIIFAAYLIPSTLLFIPLVKVMYNLKLIDSIYSLIVAYPTFTVPFATWMLMSYFRNIPFELEESAFIDGANRRQVLFKIIIPTSLPGLVTVILFSFTLSWGELIYSLVFISTVNNKTLPIGIINDLVRGDVYYWGSLMAGGLIASLPLIIVYSFLTNLYVGGLTRGAVKE